MIDVSLFFFFNDTAPTEIYTSCTLFPDTTLFRSTAGDVLLERWAQRTLAEDEPAQPRSFPAGEGRCVQQQLQPLLRVQPGCGHDEVVSLVDAELRSEEHTSELQSLMRISYAVFCLQKKTTKTTMQDTN